MTSFNHPASQPSGRQGTPLGRRATLQPGRSIPRLMGGLPRGGARIAFLAAQILRRRRIGRRSPKDAPGQCLRQQRNIWRFRPADDDRQRDATPVHDQTPLAPVFFPDPWDSAPRPPAPAAPCSTFRQYVAISKQSPTSRHIRSAPLARASRKSQPPASAKNGDEWRWNCRTVPWATPSIGCRFARQRRSRQRPVEAVTVSVPLRASGHIPAVDHVAARESAVRLSAKTHPKRAMMESSVFVSWRESLVYSAIFVNHYLGIYSKVIFLCTRQKMKTMHNRVDKPVFP